MKYHTTPHGLDLLFFLMDALFETMVDKVDAQI
jgi:hypothetical protein